MADKSFGVKELNLLNASGTPTVTSPNNLNLNANTVAISTSATVGNNLTVTSTTNSANLNVTGVGTLTRAFATDLSVSGVTTITVPANANPHSSWDVVNNSSSAYRFTGPGQDGAEDNPNIYLVRGQRYVFKMNASGHPFQIRVANGGAAYSDGVTNNGSQTGNVVFNVQHDAPAQLFYQCTSHGSMVGNIYIVGGPQVISGVVTATTFVGNLTGNPTGSGANLTNLPAANITGTLPAISGANLTGVLQEVRNDSSPQLGGILDTNGNDIDFADNVKVTFGASEDLLIKHSGTNSEIYHNGTGHLYISAQGSSEMLLLSAAADIRLSNSVSGDMYLKGISDGAVELYHDNSKKIETTSSGINVTGSVTASAPVAWYGEQDTTQNVSNASWTTVINLGNNPVNTTGWNESTGIFTVPSGQAGAYMLTGGAGIDDLQSTDWIQVGFSVNDGVPTVWSRKRAYTPVSGQIFDNNLSNIKNLNVGDTVKLQLYHSEGTVEPTEADRCWFGGHRIN